MPDEYISREAALKYIKSAQCRRCSDIGLCGNCAVLVAVKLLEKVPAADVAPVRHGRWIHTDLAAHWYGKDECNECTYHEHDRRDLSHFNYCPGCGAKMDGAAE